MVLIVVVDICMFFVVVSIRILGIFDIVVLVKNRGERWDFLRVLVNRLVIVVISVSSV